MRSVSDTAPTHRPSRRVDRGAIVLWLIMTLLAALPISGLAQGFRHTLDNREHWESTKPSLLYNLMGAVAYTTTPVTLTTNALNLGAWHGFQEVVTRELVNPTSLSFRMQLPGESSLSLIYNKTDKGFSGIRLSTSPNHPSERFTATAGGRFLTRAPLSVPALGEAWHTVTLRVEGDQIQVTLDGEPLARFTETMAPRQQVGFRGGVTYAFVDDVTLATAEDATALVDDFSPPSGYLGVLLWTFLILACGIGGLAWLLARRGGRGWHFALAIDLALIIIATPVYAADRLFLAERHGYSKLHFQVTKALGIYSNPVFGSRQDTVDRLAAASAAAQPSTLPRILFIGSSQTWGSGASGDDTHMIHLVTQGLNAEGARFDVANASIQGAKSPFLLERYTAEWHRWEPQIMVLNLSTNDVDVVAYEASLRAFVTGNNAQKVRTIFILEPNASDSTREPVEPKHVVMRKVAEELKVPVIDLHAHLIAERGAGLLWWDHVHLTDAGQAVAAEFLTAQLNAILAGD